MFLIVPKTKEPSIAFTDARYGQTTAKVTKKRFRVQAACDRCHIKKVKCDNQEPCQRCTRDGVVCLTSKRMPTDPKSALRHYVTSMEEQQIRLVTALSQVQRYFAQSLDGNEFKEIAGIVKDNDLTSTEHMRLLHSTPTPVGASDRCNDPEQTLDFDDSCMTTGDSRNSAMVSRGSSKRKAGPPTMDILSNNGPSAERSESTNAHPRVDMSNDTSVRTARKRSKLMTGGKTRSSSPPRIQESISCDDDIQDTTDPKVAQLATDIATDISGVEWLESIPSWRLQELPISFGDELGFNIDSQNSIGQLANEPESGQSLSSVSLELSSEARSESEPWWDPALLFDDGGTDTCLIN